MEKWEERWIEQQKEELLSLPAVNCVYRVYYTLTFSRFPFTESHIITDDSSRRAGMYRDQFEKEEKN